MPVAASFCSDEAPGGALRILAAAILVVLGLGATTGCLPLALGTGLLGGTGGTDNAGDRPLYGAPETSVQNGRHDPSIADALRTSEADVSDACQVALAGLERAESGDASESEKRDGPLEEPVCRTRPVCLPGAVRPVAMRLCTVPDRR